MNLLKNTQLVYAGAAVAAADDTDSNSTRIDMANWEGVVFFTTITDSTDTGTVTLTVQQNTADSDTGMAALSGAVDTALSAANDDLNGKFLAVDVFRPRERYVQAVRTTLVALGAVGEVYALLYGPRKKPVAAHSTAAGTPVAVGSPAEA